MTKNIILIISFFLYQQQISAFEISPKVASQQALEEKLSMPAADLDGRIQTLNKKGAMSPQLDQISEKFVESAIKSHQTVLEIGAGYGLTCSEALKKGAQNYTANDMDERHLKILALNLKTINAAYLQKIRLMVGSFPENIDLSPSTYDSILIARVLHSMTPNQLNVALRNIYKILKPGGRVYAVMLSPYVKGYRSFIPEFEKRISLNHPCPGYVENILEFSDTSLIPVNTLNNMEKPFLFFDTRTAQNCFEQVGFTIETCIEMPLAYDSPIWQLDGRENVGVIARKPLNEPIM